MVGVSLFCEAGSAVRGLDTRQLWWPWFACLAAAWEAFGFVPCILDGATRGRCLIVCEAGELCVSGLAFGTRQLWWPWVACLAAAWEAFGFVHCILDGATRGRCLIVLWGREALCQPRGVSGLAFGTRQLCWPWVACLAAAWEAFESVHYIIIDFVSSMYGHWYWRTVVRVRHFGFRGPVSLGAWSTWRGPWAAGRPEWRVNAGCVDVYIRELDARGA